MKRVLKCAGLLGMAAVLAVGSSSCKKQDENASIQVRIGQVEEVVFEGERAYIDQVDHLFRWNGLDYIEVYNVNLTNPMQSTRAQYQATEEAEGQTYAHFYGPKVGACQGKYFVFYPAVRFENPDGTEPALPVAGIDWPNANNREKFTIEPVQYYTTVERMGQPMVTIDPNAMAMSCEPSDLTNFELGHIFGSLQLCIKGTKIVDHIVLQNNYNAGGYGLQGMYGDIYANIAAINTTTLNSMLDCAANNDQTGLYNYMQNYVYAEDGLNAEFNMVGTDLVLDCSYNEFYEIETPEGEDPYVALKNGVRLDQVDAKSFFFSVRPGALANGVTVKIYYTDGTMQTRTRNFGTAFMARPGVMNTLNMAMTNEPYSAWD